MEKNTILAYALKNAIEHSGKAVVGSVINGLFNEGLKKKNIKKHLPNIQEIVDEINNWDLETQKTEFEKLEEKIGKRIVREGLPEIPNAKKGKVITRMSPSPSGPLHVGHALAILPNFLYAQKYDGKFYLRIEDTNPDNIYKPAYKMIEKEVKWLCKNNVKFIIQSERMNLYYKYIEKLLNKESVYVCDCELEKFKELLSAKKACPCRKLSKKEQKDRWKKMIDKSGYKPGEAVLRFKSNIKNKNPAMRDFPLARINISKHPLQKNKYRVWPLMNLAVTVDDIELGMTHIIRGKDHRDNAKRQEMIYKALGKSSKYPYVAFIGRIHLKGLQLSSTKIKSDIEAGKYSGWDDTKLLTIASLRKNYKPETLYKYAEERGISEADKNISKEDLLKVFDILSKSS
jgi:glutamyl-tRNA synthetase